MGTRFEDLEARLRTFLLAGGNIDNCQDEELRNYGRWRLFKDPSSRDLPAASERDKRGQSLLMLTPFDPNLVTGTTEAGVTISGRSKAWATSNLGKFGLTAYDADNVIWLGYFTPAKAYVRPSTATKATVDRISRITKKPYKTKFSQGDEGYTVPFGKVGTSGYSEVAADISTLAGKGVARFTPEKVRIPTDTSS
jgi:hypothetical protein